MDAQVDVKNEFSCFLCNGHITVLGSIKMEDHYLQLSKANGAMLECMQYSEVGSVMDEDPPTFHSLFINRATRSVYVSFLLRKDKLLKLFQQLGLYKDDVRLPAQELGFASSEEVKRVHSPTLQSPSGQSSEEVQPSVWESRYRNLGSEMPHVTPGSGPRVMVISMRAVSADECVVAEDGPPCPVHNPEGAVRYCVDHLRTMFPSQPEAVLERAARDAKGDVNTALTVVLSQTDGEPEQGNPPPVQQDTALPTPPSPPQDGPASFLTQAVEATPTTVVYSPVVLSLSSPATPPGPPSYDMCSHSFQSVMRYNDGDIIAAKCKHRLWELCSNQDGLYRSLHLVAGFVLSDRGGVVNGTVVALGSGFECLGVPLEPVDGGVVYNSHAIVTARRAFVRFLFSQIYRFRSNKPSVLVPHEGKLRLSPSLNVHFYTSMVPCGDARTLGKGQRSETERQLQVVSRDSMSGVPTLTLGDMREQTHEMLSDAFNPLLSMSCSDKMAAWNVTGVQGALLSRLIHPVYLDTITVGTKLSSNCENLVGEFLSRAEGVANLPSSYYGNKPDVWIPSRYTDEFVEVVKSSNRIPLAVNWVSGEGGLEIIDPAVGKRLNNNISRLCKLSMFREFQRLEAESGVGVAGGTLYKMKAAALDYYQAKSSVRGCLGGRGYGHWVCKDPHLENFTV